MAVVGRKKKDLTPHTVLIEPFDIAMYHTKDGEGLLSIQNRFAMWLRGLNSPARFVCWQMPADLRGRISYVSELARTTEEPLRKNLLMESI